MGRFWILIVAIAIIAIGGSAVAEFWPGFYPKQIVVSGNSRVDRATILRVAAIAPHRSIWLQNIHTMAARIAAIPFVGRAMVHRYPPATISIRVTERVPFAVVRRGDDDALVDDSMRVLQNAAGAGALPVFVLSGSAPFVPGTFLQSHEALALRTVDTALENRALTPATLTLDGYGQVEVKTAGGLRLLLGEPENLDDKVRLCAAIASQMSGQKRKPSIIDVRAPATPVVTYAPHR